MTEFAHLRHKPPQSLIQTRPLVVACAPMRSNINLSRIVRACGCCGIERVICCGPAKLVDKIARDGADTVTLENHRTLKPILLRLKEDGYRLVGLEQTSGACSLYQFSFARQSALVVGNERSGITDEVLKLLDDVVEIPVYGLPYSHNAATAAAIALYEYCRQFPNG